MNSPEHSKVDLRQQLRARRRALAPARQQACAEAVARHLSSTPSWQSAKTLAVYCATDSELDPTPLVALARKVGKTLYLPAILDGGRLEFRPWQPDAALHNNRFGIAEPDTAGVPASQLDLICLPLVGWDRQGTRLGMGGGYYDRSLQSAGTVIKVGLAYSLQECTQLIKEDWDVALDFVATEQSVFSCSP